MGWAALRYLVAWLLAGAAVAAVLVAALMAGSAPQALPPIRAIELGEAARLAGCELRLARPGERLNPPVDAAPGPRPARAAVYDRPPPLASLVAATRRGVVVVHFREGLAGGRIELLRLIARAMPAATIVTPNATRMPFALAATAHRRLLGCPRADDAALDAVQLFRGRYVGLGPDRPR